jgi:hypothetical protein
MATGEGGPFHIANGAGGSWGRKENTLIAIETIRKYGKYPIHIEET